MKTLSYFNFVIAALFFACYCYQFVFLIVKLLRKKRTFEAKKQCRYAVMIAARNEAAVIGQLIDSIRAQEYPQELLDIYVGADNCTDNTAEVARARGAVVFERENKEQIGKGYVLRFLLEQIRETAPDETYDGYFVFDADNLLDPHFVEEMNKVFTNGNRVVTSYRNTKNFGDNWITAGYGVFFLREAEYLNRPRDYLRTSCAVSGTGFLFADEVLQEVGGWKYFLLTEDWEFTADLVARGEKIAYCGDAVIYDEQPRGFLESTRQRSRWIRGYMQVVSKRGGSLIRRMLSAGTFGCYDMLMNTIPVVVLTVFSFILNTIMFLVGVTTARQEMGIFFASVIVSVANSYLLMYFLGAVTTLTERKRIRCSRGKKILYTFTFPLFIFSFGIAMLVGLFGRVKWTPIRHSASLSISDMGNDSQK